MPIFVQTSHGEIFAHSLREIFGSKPDESQALPSHPDNSKRTSSNFYLLSQFFWISTN
jgi:hypothetical protein